MDQNTRQRQRQQRRVSVLRSKLRSNDFFNQLTSPALLDIVEQHLPEHRERTYPPTVALAMFLSQVLSADGSCQNAVNEAQMERLADGLPMASASTSAYSQARQRLPLDLVRELARWLGGTTHQQAVDGWLWRGRTVKLVDGTTILMADTVENQAKYPQHGNQAQGVGFPIARLVAVLSLSTGSLLDVAMGPYRGKETGESALFRPLLSALEAGDVLLADRYYGSFFLVAMLLALGVDLVTEQHGARRTDFRRGKSLGVRDHEVTWTKPKRPEWMSAEEYQSFPKELTLRETKVDKKVLVTTFLDPRAVSRQELGELFAERWNVELDLRNIKTTLGMEMLRCKTPQMCEKELWVYMLAYNLIRLLMAQAAAHAGLAPRQSSFKHTVQVWIAWERRTQISVNPADLDALFALIAELRVGNRAGRVEPRAVKRRPKPYARLQTTRQKARENIRKYGRPKRKVA